MKSEGEEDSNSLSPDKDNKYLTLNDKRRLQKEKSINLRFNYPLHYTHKDRKILRRIVSTYSFPIYFIKKALNGFTKKQMTTFEEITKVEVVLETFKFMNCVEVFYNLQELILCRCDIKEIEGLNNLKQLEFVWLSENRIKEIKGIEGCTNLKKLVLSENYIERI